MTKEEKSTIYNLLKVADNYINGYERDCFSGNVVFQDDPENNTQPQTPDNYNFSNNPEITDIQTPPSSSENSENHSFTEKPDHPGQYTKSGIPGIPESPEHHENSQIIHTPTQNTKESSGITIEQLNSKIIRCTRCGLARTRNNVVPGEGVSNPDVFVIGEGPGYDEDMQGRPFVGKAGVLLDKMLIAINLDRKVNCFIGNIVKCRPPENRNPFPDEEDACFPFLETQIHIMKPKMILCLGKVAIEKLMGQKISINASHGQFFDYNGIPTMVTYHPSALLRNLELKRPAWEDLKGFRRKLDSILSN